MAEIDCFSSCCTFLAFEKNTFLRGVVCKLDKILEIVFSSCFRIWSPSSLAMWKFCEVEICPWHEKRSKRKEVSANRKSKKKFFRKDNESDNDREISDDTKIKAKMNCDPGPHIEKEDISPGAARRESEGKITTGPQTSASGLKKRPKTAPASSNQQVRLYSTVQYSTVQYSTVVVILSG